MVARAALISGEMHCRNDPTMAWKGPDRLRKEFTNESIKQFAETLSIAPGIIVGRLQRERLLKYSQGNRLKQKFHWRITS